MKNQSKYDDFLQKLTLAQQKLNQEDADKLFERLIKTKENGRKVFVVGNGGSAALASHISVDLMRTLKFRGINFNEAGLLTCFSNDYGYENWVKEALKIHATRDDLVILISSSGMSPNILNAAKQSVLMGLDLITFSGFSPQNPLRELGNLNFWVDSSNYNVIETTHQVRLLAVIEALINQKK